MITLILLKNNVNSWKLIDYYIKDFMYTKRIKAKGIEDIVIKPCAWMRWIILFKGN